MPGNVLIVEDHEATARLMRTLVEEREPPVSAHVVGDGRACLTVLRSDDDAIPPPDLVLLDLDLPEVGGLAVLETRREDAMVPDVPMVVVSGSDDQATIRACYQLGADAFVAKPRDLDAYSTAVEGILTFWMGAGDSSISADEGDTRDHDQRTVTES